MKKYSRRNFLGVSAKAASGVMFAGTLAPTATSFFGLAGVAEASDKILSPFTFAVISDSHLYEEPGHRFDAFLEKAVAEVNALNPQPDFVLYGGDLGQFGKPAELAKGQKILSKLKPKLVIIPGEHDWYLDMGEAWKGHFGPDHWSFDHKGVHFIGMNSILVKDFWTGEGLTPHERMARMEELECHNCGPWGVGEEQLEWLKNDVKNLSPKTPVFIATHSPLWDYYPRWNFQTRDAPEIRDILSKFERVMAIHGHVHQVVYNQIGNISSAGLLSTSWPWPYPPVKLPYPQFKQGRSDPGNFEDGLGLHTVDISQMRPDADINYREFANVLPENLRKGLKI